jgi:putative hydrolase
VAEGDDLFSQLFELFQSSGPVNWKLARELTKNLAGEREPIDPKLTEEYLELAHAAELRIEAVSALPAPAPGDLNPTDRATWAADNQQTFRVVVEPLAGKFTGGFGDVAGGDPAGLGSMLAPMGPALLGMQAGTMVGALAHRTLGQFDTGIPAVDHNRPYVVVPNVEAFAVDSGLDPKQVRLWAVLHEMVFQRLMEIEWLRGHFVSLVEAFYDTVEFDFTDLMGSLTALEDPSQIQELLGDDASSSPALFKETSDPERLAAVQAFAAFLEGYGDYVVREAAGTLLPDLEQIEQANAIRRSEPEKNEQPMPQLAGLVLRRELSEDAAEFCREVERRWGKEALDRLWEDPENLPLFQELTDPLGWAARVLLA